MTIYLVLSYALGFIASFFIFADNMENNYPYNDLGHLVDEESQGRYVATKWVSILILLTGPISVPILTGYLIFKGLTFAIESLMKDIAVFKRLSDSKRVVDNNDE